MSEFREIHRETGIPCFECGKRSGLDCAGRLPDEATRCEVCLRAWVKNEEKIQADHEKAYFESQSQSSQSSTKGSSGGTV